MNKKTKWGLIAIIVIGLAGMAIHTFMPRENKELAQAPGKPKTSNRSRTCILRIHNIQSSHDRKTCIIIFTGKLIEKRHQSVSHTHVFIGNTLCDFTK